jgi:hypothetical protein
VKLQRDHKTGMVKSWFYCSIAGITTGHKGALCLEACCMADMVSSIALVTGLAVEPMLETLHERITPAMSGASMALLFDGDLCELFAVPLRRAPAKSERNRWIPSAEIRSQPHEHTGDGSAFT